jgi:hypothetical protein
MAALATTLGRVTGLTSTSLAIGWHHTQHLAHLDTIGVFHLAPTRNVPHRLTILKRNAQQGITRLDGVIARLSRIFPALRL